METFNHTINTLFQQLGLDSSDKAIDSFIKQHSPISSGTLLYRANFWKPSQADFLKQAVDEDSDWTGVVDNLNSMLR